MESSSLQESSHHGLDFDYKEEARERLFNASWSHSSAISWSGWYRGWSINCWIEEAIFKLIGFAVGGNDLLILDQKSWSIVG